MRNSAPPLNIIAPPWASGVQPGDPQMGTARNYQVAWEATAADPFDSVGLQIDGDFPWRCWGFEAVYDSLSPLVGDMAVRIRLPDGGYLCDDFAYVSDLAGPMWPLMPAAAGGLLLFDFWLINNNAAEGSNFGELRLLGFKVRG